MWERFVELLRCPLCKGSLELMPIERRSAAVSSEHRARGERLGLTAARTTSAVESGVIVCRSCRLWYPLLHGLPVLLPYTTAVHEEFLGAHAGAVRRLGDGYRSPGETPTVGEEFVLRTFSKEWLEYSYDGVLWIWSYEDREAMFLGEIGREPAPPVPGMFLEIGCGLGLVTSFAAEHFPGDAVGVDLSLAAMRAAHHFRDNPFLHFVEASLFRLPLPTEQFDLVYSHGVLHHTYSTEAAFKAVAPHCKPGGRMYVWLYGIGSTNENIFRRMATAAEWLLRPTLSRMPPRAANVVLAPLAVAYIGINWLQRRLGSPRQAYNFSRALHVARDRMTPLFAYHTESAVVARWFKEMGFEDLHQVAQQEVPASAAVVMRRDVGMRGRRAQRPAPARS